jgi:hypothetical protein
MKKSAWIIILSLFVVIMVILAYILFFNSQKLLNKPNTYVEPAVAEEAEPGYYCETIYDCIMIPDECGCERGGKWLLMNQSSSEEYIQKGNEDFLKGILPNCTEAPSSDPTCVDSNKIDFQCINNFCKLILL